MAAFAISRLAAAPDVASAIAATVELAMLESISTQMANDMVRPLIHYGTSSLGLLSVVAIVPGMNILPWNMRISILPCIITTAWLGQLLVAAELIESQIARPCTLVLVLFPVLLGCRLGLLRAATREIQMTYWFR